MASPKNILTCVAMSPFSSTIDGGWSAPPVRSVSASAAASAVADARIHRLGCRRWPQEGPPFLVARLQRPGHARADVAERRRRGDRTAAALDTKAAVLLDKALAATDLSGRGGRAGRDCLVCCQPSRSFARRLFWPGHVLRVLVQRPAFSKRVGCIHLLCRRGPMAGTREKTRNQGP